MRRDTRNAVLGGVCAGIANSIGMPILTVRLLFIFMTVWMGAPLIIYPLLWILMPVQGIQAQSFSLERDGKNAILFGVCAGLSNSSGGKISASLIRLFWLLSLIYFGFGVLPYIILAILMPKKAG
jgi:phage shock protein PspC (stress-responsive transcriptional regulator)